MRVNQRRGAVLIYGIVGMVTLCGIVSLGVDFGRVQIARSQLQSAADSAARYAVTGVKHEISGVNACEGMARAILRENKVDASFLTDPQSTIEYGEWTQSDRTFKPKHQTSKRNAVKVTVKCDESTNSAIPLLFGSMIGKSKQKLEAFAIATIDESSSELASDHYQQRYIPATSNPWLAGMPDGTKANVGNPRNNPDTAGSSKQSPILFKDLALRAGSTLTFDGVNGGANNMTSTTLFTGDGNLDWIVSNMVGNEHGKSDINAPINSVVAVFINDNVPSGSAPTKLDFSSRTSRDFSTLSPQLSQVFFIGDGRRDNGDMQQFVIPSGATRLIIGTMDGWEWNNNVGGFTVTVTTTPTVKLVQ